MIKRWQNLLNQVNRLLDGLILFTSYFSAVHFWLYVIRHDPRNLALQITRTTWYALVFALLLVILYQVVGLYDSKRVKRFSGDVRWVLLLNALAVLAGAAFLYVFRMENFSRGVLAMAYVFSSLAILLKRYAVRTLLHYLRKKGYNQRHVLLVGSGKLAQKYVETLRKNPEYGYTIDGYLGRDRSIADVPYLGTWEEAGSRVLEQSEADEVVAALDEDSISYLPGIIAATEKHGTKVSIVPYFNDYIPASTSLETLGDCKLLSTRTIPLDYPANAILKRAFDIVGSVLLILVTSPVMLAAAVGVKLSSPGPVIFRQTRIGRGKKPFEMYKFRSMRVNAQENTAWSTNDDPRKTRFGSLLRKTSVDELPQFFNVLKGDMSLIGPRPELPYFVDQFRETVPLYMLKHLVRPGITGWAQVHGFRGDTSIEGRVQHDIWYIEHWSIGLDLRICLMTAFGGMFNREKMRGAEPRA